MTVAEQKQRALKFIDNIDRRQPEIFDQLITHDFVFEIMGRLPGLEPLSGKDNFIAQFIPMVRRLLPNGMNFRYSTVICEGPHVAIQGESDTTAANGRRYNNRYHWYVQFAGDLICRVREYADTNLIREISAD